MSTLLRQHAEQQFAEELHELKQNETNPFRRIGRCLRSQWLPTRWAVNRKTDLKFLLNI